jgi:hypothetical protein
MIIIEPRASTYQTPFGRTASPPHDQLKLISIHI